MSRNVLLVPVAAVAIATAAASAAPVTLPGGTRIEDVKIGTGPAAQAGQTVTVHYTGWLYVDGQRGAKFDSSRNPGRGPFSFLLGGGEVIPGWDEGVAGMKPGGKRTLILPPAAGYGDEGDDTIPPNSWLIFEVELLGIE
jgi:FKBP-type peptidyl-prolyl cis-trans isomerase